MPYLILFGIALVIRLATAFVVYQPGFVDAYYYYQIAANWYAGKGFTETTVWNYQVAASFEPLAPGVLDHPAFTYWQPLATILTGLPMFLFGANFWAGSLLFILSAAALPPVAYWLGRLVFGKEQTRYSWLMALVMLFPGRYFLFWSAPDNFAPYALITMLLLATIYIGLYQNDRWLISAGGLAGLAYLSRNDGILLTATLILAFGWRYWQLSKKSSSDVKEAKTEKKPRLIMLAVGLGVALLVVSPWLVRNGLTFGTILPGSSTKMIFLRNYLDFFSYATPIDPAHYFEQGLPAILGSKLAALGTNALLLVFQGLFLLGPLFVIGLFNLKRYPALLPFTIYTGLLYLTMALAYTEIGSRGTIFHSAGGILPYQTGLALAGWEWIRHGKASPRVAVALGLIAVGVTLYFTLAFSAPEWNTDYQNAAELEKWFQRNAAPKDVIMIAEPLSFQYATNRPAIAQASDGLAANLAAAKRYGVRWFVLEKARYDGLDSLEKEKKAATAGVEFILFETLDNGTQIYQVVQT